MLAALAVAGAADAQTGAPAAPAPAAGDPAFEPVTKMDGPILQVVFGQRALFHLDEEGVPVLDKVENGQLAIAHPPGAATETFTKPARGQIAVALDGSQEKRSTYLKVWNGYDAPIAYRGRILAIKGGKLAPRLVKVCAVEAGKTNYEIWSEPVVAIALSEFGRTEDPTACQ